MINNQVEYILCSAIWYLDYPVPVEKNSNLLPVNCDKGIVFCGHRHVHCLRQMNVVWNKRQAEAGKEIQGFLTNLNRFVDRKEGALIAYNAGQLNNRVSWDVSKQDKWNLYSEDLY